MHSEESKFSPNIQLAINKNKHISLDIKCPISKDLFINPFIYSDGFTYEEHLIKKWTKKNSKSPMTGAKIHKPSLLQNKNLSFIINKFTTQIIRINYQLQPKSDSNYSADQIKKFWEGVETLNHHKELLYAGNLPYPEWESLLFESLKKYPDNPSILFSIIDHYSKEKTFDICYTHIKMVEKYYPESLIHKYPLVKIYSSEEKSEQANKLFNDIVMSFPIWEHTLLEARTYVCCWLLENVSYSFNALNVSRYLGKYTSNNSWFLGAEICILFHKKQFEKVIELSDFHFHKYGKDELVIYKKAIALLCLYKYEEAIEPLTMYIEKISIPKWLYSAYYHRGICKKEINDPSFQEDLEKAHELCPSKISDILLAFLFIDMNLTDKIKEYCQKFEERQVDLKPLKIVDLKLYSEVLMFLEKNERAIEVFLELSEKDPDNVLIYNQKINSLLKKKPNLELENNTSN